MAEVKRGGSRSSYGGIPAKDGDFEEQQVWESMHETTGYSYNSPKLFSSSDSSGAGAKAVTHPHSSAPMAIPDWQKIYGSVHSSSFGFQAGYKEYYGHDDDDGENEMMPPHEFIAKKLAGNQISSFSVCEGAGRTLKGRDLSRVRNAVLTKTGFIE